jgi:hypothetical protein
MIRNARPWREFGSEKPKVIYVALRWNSSKVRPDQEKRAVQMVADKLKIQKEDLKFFNLVRPSWGEGMNLSPKEFFQVAETINRIQSLVKVNPVRTIVVGGRSGPMPIVALFLKMLCPKVRVEIRNHHKSRKVNGPPLKLLAVVRI